MNPLEGKVALVTGASRGIGSGIALSLAQAGADVVVNYRSRAGEAQEVARMIQKIGRRALPLAADVADRSAMEALFAEAIGQFGHIDIVVANASYNSGYEEAGPVIKANWADVQRRLEVTQFGVFHTCQLAAQQMIRQTAAGRRGGKIIIISSVHSQMAVPNYAAYNMAKVAVVHFGRTLAIELAPYCINVNAINPGSIDTPGSCDLLGERANTRWKRIPWGRTGTPEDIGKAAAFLAGPDADYVTGATLLVDGGWVLGVTLPEQQAFVG